ncbi:MAG: thioredoxin family protein [Ignavibacteriae bacterium]|nr:thioredoxin family protein [Ignavibacteriota bacterium]
MAATPSNMLALGTIAPDFKLFDTVSGNTVSLAELKSGIATVIMFICNHCPYVKHINSELVSISNYYIQKGISFVAISSNDIENYPEDSPENMKLTAEELGYKFPYLFDESQGIAKAYKAACTPDFYIFDKDLNLVYRGQFDYSRPGNGIPVTGTDIRSALDNILSGKPMSREQKPSIGCNIKWRIEN